jgi:hypothetical protein
LSSNAAALTVPASTLVAAGSATATFNATSGSLSSNQTATVTAAYNSTSATASISLTAPVQVSSLTCSPATLGQNSSSICTVTLTQVAPAGGASVVLSSNAAALTVPASTLVAAGSATATINATSGSLSSNQTAIVTATYNSTSATASISLTAPTTVSGVSPNSGATAGGTSVTVTGTGFAAGAMITFGATDATDVVIVNSTTIAAATPAGSAGAVTVTVTNPGAQSEGLANGFTYVVPTVTAITYVQGNSATPQASQTVVNVTFTAAQAAGDLNVVVAGWKDSSAVVKAVADSSGNTYVPAVGPTVQRRYASQSIYYAKNIAPNAAGTNTVTVTFATAAKSPDIRILEYSGADPSNPVDVTAASTGDSTTSGSGAMATTNATDLLFGANVVQSVTTGPCSGCTERLLTPDGDIAEDRGVTATGNYRITAPLSPSARWIMQMVAFRTAAANEQTESLARTISYSLPPTVGTVSPGSGSLAGGVTVTIAGTNFAPGATVTFGGKAAASVVVSGTEITATAPGGNAGPVTVTVTNLAAQSGNLADGFTYVETLATPILVSHLSESNSRSSAVSSPWQFNFHLADPATSGNAIVVACQFEGAAMLAITDNQSDSYKNAEVYYDAANNQSVVIAESFNVIAGAYDLTATWDAETSKFQCVSSQIANVTAADGPGTGNEGSGTSVTAGSITPAVTGDLVYQVAASLSGTLTQASFTAGRQSDITWDLESADLKDGMAVQAGAYSSTSAIDPAMTVGTSATWMSAAVLLKSGSAGGVPAGLRVAYEVHENIPNTIAAGGTGSGWTNPMTLQIPCISGATVAAMMNGSGNGTASTISAIADSNGNAWSQIALYTDNANSVYAQAYYAKSVMCSSNTETLTIAFAANTGDNTMVFYVLAGASADPLDTYSGDGRDVEISSSTATANYTLTPAEPNELVISAGHWYHDTAVRVADDGGWLHYYANSIGPISFTYNGLSSTEANGASIGIAVAFK